MTAPKDCQKCPLLVKERKQVVQGSGPTHAKIVFVGEGPGEVEDSKGRPFIGKAGRVLRILEWAVGINQHLVYYTNATRCWSGRNPKPTEIDACHGYLIDEITAINPAVVVALGGPAIRSLYRPGVGVREVMGFTLYNDELPGIPIIPTYHPSYIMRNHWDEAAIVLEHFTKAKRIADGGGIVEKYGSYAGVTTLDDLRAMRDYLLRPEVGLIAVDTETTGLSWMDSELLDISLSIEQGISFVVPILHRGERTIMKMKGRGKNRREEPHTEYWPVPFWDLDTEMPEVIEILDEILSSDKPKGGQNIGFDLRILERSTDEEVVTASTAFGFYVNNVTQDTRLLSTLTSESTPANLTLLTALHTAIPYYEGGGSTHIDLDTALRSMVQYCTCGQVTVIQTESIMAAVCAEAATRKQSAQKTQGLPAAPPRNGPALTEKRSDDSTERDTPPTKSISSSKPGPTTNSIEGASLESPGAKPSSVITVSLGKSMTASRRLKEVSALFAGKFPAGVLSSTMTMLQAASGGFSVGDATLRSAGLEILKRLYYAHSPTCGATEYHTLTSTGLLQKFPGIKKFKSKMWHLPDERRWDYAGADVDAVQSLIPPLHAKVLAEKTDWVYENISIPLIRCATKLEERGVYIDRDHFDKLCRYYGDRLAEEKAKLNEIVGYAVDSPSYYQTVQEIVFKDYGLPLAVQATKGAKKDCLKCKKLQGPCSIPHTSTSASDLAELNEAHPHKVLPVLVDIRHLEKFKSTYMDGKDGEGGFAFHIRSDGRIHARWNSARAATGRFSCEYPNLMNPPKEVSIHDEKYGLDSNDAVRDMFGAPPGFGILNADWSQAEVWVMAYETQDEILLGLLMDGVDIHAHVARELCRLGVSSKFPLESVDESLSLDEWKVKYKGIRDRGKVFVFGMNYGLTEDGAAERLNCTKTEAAPLLAHYIQAIFPKMSSFFLRVRTELFERGTIGNKFGRLRHFMEVPILRALRYRGDLEGVVRQGFNMPIQSGAHDLHSLAHIATERELSMWVEPVLEMHDSLMMYSPLERLEEAAVAVKSLWQDVAKNTRLSNGERLDWQIPVDVQIGQSFGSLQSI